MVGLIQMVEKFKNDPSTSREAVKEYKWKINEYKQKVKTANQMIDKLVKMQTQIPQSAQNVDLLR